MSALDGALDVLNFVCGTWTAELRSAGEVAEQQHAGATRTLVDPNTNAPRVALPIPNELLDDADEDDAAAGLWTTERISASIRCATPSMIDAAVAFARSGHHAAERCTDAAAAAWFGAENIAARQQAMSRLAELLAANQNLAEALTLSDAFEVGLPRHETKLIASGFAPIIESTAAHCADHLRHCNSVTLRGPPLPGGSTNAALHAKLGGVRCRRVPHKVVAIVAPWNVPIGTVLPKVVAALVAGCSVILKPSEYAPTSITLLVRLLHKLRLPPSALQVVQGGSDIGQALVSHRGVGCVQFTGRTATAERIAVACAPRLASFMAECGGANAAVILPGADIAAALPHLAMGMCLLNGQWCMGISRIFVDAARRAELLHQLLSYLNEHVILCPSHSFAPSFAAPGSTSPERRTWPHSEFGESDVLVPPSDSALLVGPLAFEQHAANVRALIARIGGTAIAVGATTGLPPLAAPSAPDTTTSTTSPEPAVAPPALSPACFVQPTVIVDGDEAVTALMELFAPVVAVHTFRTVREAIALANESPGQLATYLFVPPNGEIMEAEGASDRGADGEAGGEVVPPITIDDVRFAFRSSMVMINSVGFGFEPGPDDVSTSIGGGIQLHGHSTAPPDGSGVAAATAAHGAAATAAASSDSKSNTKSSGIHPAAMSPQVEFAGTSGFGRDGNGAALAELFTMPRWSGVCGP